ncbi:MAG: ADP-forming succinate--CoA ligase subunit beta [Anaerolineaceae bacterium]|nr:ADP-forming succinate--CoA ligase subunit beta [Anaerolineaceae bacterium]
MKLHEYQAKRLFADFGISIPKGRVASNANQVKEIANELGCPVVIKSQVLVGGRGKAGGIRLAKTSKEAKEFATKILGTEIKGLPVKNVLVDEAIDIKQEIYFGIVNDRTMRKPVLMASSEGGIEIEELALRNPEKIFKIYINPLIGLRDYQIKNLASSMDLPKSLWKEFINTANGLWALFNSIDATLAEINPLVITKDDRIIALDGKMIIDDNAIFRQPMISDMRDVDIEEPEEVEARKFSLSYIKLDGEIGCMVNGAGLAMATMDIIKEFGGNPANFLDIGGGASADKVAAALKIILSDKSVKAILINIFGGITRCDEVAKGILLALEDVNTTMPIVVRLTGTNDQEGLKILQEANLDAAESLVDCAKKAIQRSKGE